MNFTETFQDFSNKLGPTDLALYAGIAVVLWVLFGEKLGGFKDLLNLLIGKFNLKSVVSVPNIKNNNKFFQLLTLWKKTRDLADELGCVDAVKAADQMFPCLGPSICNGNKEKDKLV